MVGFISQRTMSVSTQISLDRLLNWFWTIGISAILRKNLPLVCFQTLFVSQCSMERYAQNKSSWVGIKRLWRAVGR
eukprot:jgi/Hompol1/1680/HPOL_005682-RA